MKIKNIGNIRTSMYTHTHRLKVAERKIEGDVILMHLISDVVNVNFRQKKTCVTLLELLDYLLTI